MIVNLVLGIACGVVYWWVLGDRVSRWRGLVALMCAILLTQFVTHALR